MAQNLLYKYPTSTGLAIAVLPYPHPRTGRVLGDTQNDWNIVAAKRTPSPNAREAWGMSLVRGVSL